MSRFSTEAVFKGTDNFSGVVGRMSSRMDKFTRGITSGAKMVGRLGSMAGTALVEGFRLGARAIGEAFEALNEITDRAGDLADRSARLKFPIEELQTWAFAAEQSGISTEEFDKGLDGFNKRLGEVKLGVGGLDDKLQKLNPTLLKQLKGAKDTSEAFGISIEALRAVKGPAEQAALANMLFGKSGAKMAMMAVESADAIAGLRAEALANGVVTLEQAKAAELWGDTVNSLKKAFGGLLQNILLPLVPQLTELAAATRLWIVENRELIGQKFEGFKAFISGLAENLPTIMKWAKLFGGIAVVLGIVATAAIALQVVFLATLFAPVVAIVAAWAFFPEFFGGLWNKIKSIASDAADFMIGVWEGVKAFFVGTWEFIAGLTFIAVESTRAVWEPIVGFFSGILGAVSAAFSVAWEGVLGAARIVYDKFTQLWEPIGSFFSNLWSGIIDSFSSVLGPIFDKVVELVRQVQSIGREGLEKGSPLPKPLPIPELPAGAVPVLPVPGFTPPRALTPAGFTSAAVPLVPEIPFGNRRGQPSNDNGGDEPQASSSQSHVPHVMSSTQHQTEILRREIQQSREEVTIKIENPTPQQVKVLRSKVNKPSGLNMPKTGGMR